MLTSSPNISAPPSPSASFHHHPPTRTYHASRRPSSSTYSPRFRAQVSAASPRRPDAAPPIPSASVSAPSPAIAPSPRAPQAQRREYADAGTQYTPPGFPPTYHTTASGTTNISVAAEEDSILAEPSRKITERGGTSAAHGITEPPEPNPRIDPHPVQPGQHGQGSAMEAAQGRSAQATQQTTKQNQSSTAHPEEASPPKRQRPQDPELKIMPLRYETCDVKDLGVLISDMLMELVRLNDGIPLKDGQLTRFHSRAPPAISVRDYLFRLIVHATLSPPILLSMVFYVDRLCSLYPAFTISSLTVHRFLITAATVAAKGLSDSFWTNSQYARVGGVSLKELALLELEFLRRVEWRIVPKPETLVDYYKWLVERGEGYVMEKEPETSSSSSTGPTQAGGSIAAGGPAAPDTDAIHTASAGPSMETDSRNRADAAPN